MDGTTPLPSLHDLVAQDVDGDGPVRLVSIMRHWRPPADAEWYRLVESRILHARMCRGPSGRPAYVVDERELGIAYQLHLVARAGLPLRPIGRALAAALRPLDDAGRAAFLDSAFAVQTPTGWMLARNRNEVPPDAVRVVVLGLLGGRAA